MVNGAVVSVRNKGDKIGMWLGDSSKGDSIITIGKKVKERLGIEPRVREKARGRLLLLPALSVLLVVIVSDHPWVRGSSGHNEEIGQHRKEQIRGLRRE